MGRAVLQSREAWSLLGLSLLAIACDSDDIPKGPDLVLCNCACSTQTPTGSSDPLGGCTTSTTCDPSCGDLTCSSSGACRLNCTNAPTINTIGSSDTVPLRICVDSNDSSLVARACQQRCDDYASGDVRECAGAILEQLGIADDVSDVVPESLLPRVNPDSAQSVADIIVEECGTWLLDSLTGTCGVATQGLNGLRDLLFCIWSPTDPFTLGAPKQIRQCFPAGSSLASKNGCPEYTKNDSGTAVDSGKLDATEAVDSESSAVTIAGPDIQSKTLKPTGTASTGRIGPIVLVSQLRLELPSTTLDFDGHDVPLENASFFLEGPVAAALTPGEVITFAPGKVRAILSGRLAGENTAVGAVNTTPLSGHYDEAAGVFDLSGSFQLSGFAAAFSASVSYRFVNRPPHADAGPDRTIECALQTREAVVPLSAGSSADPDPGDRIARYVWTAGRQLVSDGPDAAIAVATLGLGTRIATLTTIDTHGSMARDTALIHVVDTAAPTFPPLPPIINSVCEPGVDEVRIPIPVVPDACSPSTEVTGNIVSLNGSVITPIPVVDQTLQLAAGTYQIVWKATDQSGNSSTAPQTLIVRGGIEAALDIDVRDGANVRGVTGSYASLMALGNGTVTIGVEAHTGTLLTRGSVWLRDRSTVHGDVTYAGQLTRQNLTTVLGVTASKPELALPLGRDLSGIVFPPLSSGNLALEPNEVRSANPGAYANVVVKTGAKLSLAAGRYFIGSFDLEPNAELRLTQPVELFVNGSAILRGRLTSVSGDASSFVFGFSGTQNVAVEAPFPAGALVAPNAKVVIGSLGESAFRGQLFAQRVEIQPGAMVTCSAVTGSVPSL